MENGSSSCICCFVAWCSPDRVLWFVGYSFSDPIGCLVFSLVDSSLFSLVDSSLFSLVGFFSDLIGWFFLCSHWLVYAYLIVHSSLHAVVCVSVLQITLISCQRFPAKAHFLGFWAIYAEQNSCTTSIDTHFSVLQSLCRTRLLPYEGMRVY